MPDWVLVNPGDVGLALDTQYGAPLAFFSLPAVFLACRRGLGKRRNIPSDETVRDTPWERVPGAVQRVTLLRRTGSARERMWTPDQQRTTPQGGAPRSIRGTPKRARLLRRDLSWHRRRIGEIGGQLRISRLGVLHRFLLDRPVATDAVGQRE